MNKINDSYDPKRDHDLGSFSNYDGYNQSKKDSNSGSSLKFSPKHSASYNDNADDFTYKKPLGSKRKITPENIEEKPYYKHTSAAHSTTRSKRYADEYSRYYDDDSDAYEHEYEYCRKPKKKKSKLKKFFIGLSCTVLGLILVFVILGFVMAATVPEKTHILLMATDEDGTRTDTIMLVCYDKDKDKIDIISIPRDTLVEVSDSAFEKMQREYPEPGDQKMKINAVHHFAGKKYGVELLTKEVEDIFDIKIDYYVKVDFKAFRYIIDSVGGIEFYVPQDMEYHDDYQNLHISLKEGKQRLNGKEAEQLVRYRSGYADGDLGRVKVQQDFMNAFISQVMSKNNILSYPKVYWNLLFDDDYIETDVDFLDGWGYIFCAADLDSKSIRTCTLPGSPSYYSGQSVYIPDEDAVEELSRSRLK